MQLPYDRPFRKLMALVLTAVLMLSLLPLSALAADYDGHWAAPAIEKSRTYGIMNGDGSGHFRPGAPVTRAEFAAMVNRAFNFTETAGAATFTDVPAGAWYENDIKIASAMGYMNGVGGGKAAPAENITREQAFTILARVFKLSGSETARTKFSDDAQISSWARAAVNSLTGAGYISGSDGKVSPKADITRGEAAQAFINLAGDIADKDISGGTYQNLTIRKMGVTLTNTVINGDLFITGGVTLDNVTVKGRTLITGSGPSAVNITGSDLGTLQINSRRETHVQVDGGAKTDDIIMDSTSSVSYGNAKVSYDAATGKLAVSGNVDKVTVNDDGSMAVIIDGVEHSVPASADNMPKTVIEAAAGAVVKDMELNAPANITGSGTVEQMEVHTDGVEIGGNIDVDPDYIETDKDVLLTIGGKDYVGTGEKSIPVTTPGASGGGGGGSTTYYTVMFDANGGSAVPPITNITYGSNISEPDAPTNSGYIFGGWYKEAALTNPWNFCTDRVTGNITLYAKWTPVAVTTISASTSDNGATVTVTLVNGTFAAAAESQSAANWTISTGETGLTLGTITRSSDTQATVTFSGTVTADGTITLNPAAAALATGTVPATPASVGVTLPAILGGTAAITGTNKIGQTLTVNTNGITGGGAPFLYQWKADGADIAGANGQTYVIQGTDVGKVITCVVTHAAVGGSVTATGQKVPYTIKILMQNNETGDTVTAAPDTGDDGASITLSYTVANTAVYNLLDFSGVGAAIASVSAAGSGTRTYNLDADDASANGEITIIATFTHTNLTSDPIAFTDTATPIAKTYGDNPFTNAITNAHQGSGAITYESSDTAVATVDNSGQVTIRKAGAAVITATKAADATYAQATASYTLNVDPKPVTITGLSAQDKEYDGNTTAIVTGTATISGLVGSDTVTVSAGTAAFGDQNAGSSITVVFSGYSLDGADAGNYTLSSQPANVQADITAKTVTIIGFNIAKVYDGADTVTDFGTLTFSGLVGAETATVGTTGVTATYAAVTVGTHNITFNGSFNMTGGTANASNYAITQPTGLTGTIAKASPAAPNAPGEASKDATTVTLTVPSSANTLFALEYAFNTADAAPSGGWQDGLTFTGLTPNTTYYFYARYKESENNNASEVSARLQVTTNGSLPQITDFTISGGNKTYNETAQGATVNYAGSLDATKAGAITVYYTGANGTSYSESTVAPTNAGIYDVKVTTAGGTEYGAMTTALTVGTLTIGKASPSITWPSGLTATYGQALSEIIITGGSSTPAGVFVWEGGSTVPAVGTNSYNMVFTPDDTDNYDYTGVAGWNSGTGKVTQMVSVTVGIKSLTLGSPSTSDMLLTSMDTNGTTYTVTIPVFGMVAGDTLTSSDITITGSMTNAGAAFDSFADGLLTVKISKISSAAESGSFIFSVDSDSYTSDNKTVSVTIDTNIGNDAGTAIPVNQFNIYRFNTYANGTTGRTKHYKLIEDIDLTGLDNDGDSENGNWTPIGTSDTSLFDGSFNGNGHTITGLIINLPDTAGVGMFGFTGNTAVIENLGLIGGSIKGISNTGGVVGYNSGLVRNCYTTGDVDGGSIGNGIGGVVGLNDSSGTVQNCYATGSVSGSSNVGGVAGSNLGTVQNCYAIGDVSGNSSVGGVVGVSSGTVKNSVALNPSVSASGLSPNVGRVIGRHITAATFTNNYARADMSYISGGSNFDDGTDIASTQISDQNWWNGTTTGVWDTAAWDFTSPWMWENGYLPYLSANHKISVASLSLAA